MLKKSDIKTNYPIEIIVRFCLTRIRTMTAGRRDGMSAASPSMRLFIVGVRAHDRQAS